jgi:chromosome segregation ATPase
LERLSYVEGKHKEATLKLSASAGILLVAEDEIEDLEQLRAELLDAKQRLERSLESQGSELCSLKARLEEKETEACELLASKLSLSGEVSRLQSELDELRQSRSVSRVSAVSVKPSHVPVRSMSANVSNVRIRAEQKLIKLSASSPSSSSETKLECHLNELISWNLFI